MSRILSSASLGEAQTVALGALGRSGGSPFQARFAPRDEGFVRQSGPLAAAPPPVAAAPVPPPADPVDPVEQASAEGFAQGFDEGMRIATEGFAADEEAKARLARALEQIAPAANGALSSLLSAAVLRLVTQVVGTAGVDTALLTKRVEAVAAFIEEEQGRKSLRLHPDDIALLAGHEFGFALSPDPALTRGSVRLDTAEGWIEDGPDVQLSRLKAMLDSMEGPGGEQA